MRDLDTFYGPNAGYVLEQYERYLQNPAYVDAATRAIFDTWGQENQSTRAEDKEKTNGSSPFQVSQVVAASALAHAIRAQGHLGAHLDPLGTEPLGDPALLPESHGITAEELSLLPPVVVGGHAAEGARNALEAITNLRSMYSGTISYEFDQVKSPIERTWLRDAVGLRLFHETQEPTARRKLLQRLTQIEVFERFLHQTYPGQKRFSLEGTDTLVPMLDEIILGAIESGSREVIIGMAHRGRLNVLAHVLGKSYTAILSEFGHAKHEEGVPLTDSFGFGLTGDVKYHLGAEHILGEEASVNLKVILSPNPSHLEFVNPVIEGMTRALQTVSDVAGAPLQEVDHALPVLIHGDAAFPGEGVVAETLNLWQLHGYWVGGTIHIIVNNQLGFTTEPEDSRSTQFASDLAKGFEIPIIHVNADDPDACLTAVRLSQAYRDHFHKDVLIDLVGYRRWGHNEGDEPAFTQPRMYDIIRSHPTVRDLYARYLIGKGVVSQEEVDSMVKNAFAMLEQAKQEADSGLELEDDELDGLNGDNYHDERVPQVSAEQLINYNSELLSWPEGFTPNAKLVRLLQRRATTLGPEGGIDWGQAEALAFASILADGTPIRITGQDVERGTFSHRHAVLHDQHNESYIPLQHLSSARASFSIYNSPLSEAAPLGFEYGYSVQAPNTLVLWEAQFGDFANAAQVIIDQFIASGRAKWKQKSSLVLLLPHGYEGQGPEHSSARLERYLQLSAHNNWRIANCSTASQYFHLLRQQAFYLWLDPRPLVIMTPKSLLRHTLSTTTLTELAEGEFQPVIDDTMALTHTSDIRKVLLCTGKVSIDLLSHPKRAEAEDVAIVRLEQLYPFPREELQKVLSSYPHLQEVVWVQEEPHNMGAWGYLSPLLSTLVGQQARVRVIARPERASPASGFMDLFLAEQEQILTQALGSFSKERGGKYAR
ncbi:MAG: 2-oxoglutarate dehydrogenase E1 component [Chloroflexi bacterium]|nr:MAG: 2-oxoglutarate dehydrogenase E1 component [Chloroflexota bacterium]